MKYNVCVQGLGFVGSAMAIAIASQGHGKYSVVGIDLDTYEGKDRVNKINQGLFPFGHGHVRGTCVHTLRASSCS